jgi:hypothetical protein
MKIEEKSGIPNTLHAVHDLYYYSGQNEPWNEIVTGGDCDKMKALLQDFRATKHAVPALVAWLHTHKVLDLGRTDAGHGKEWLRPGEKQITRLARLWEAVVAGASPESDQRATALPFLLCAYEEIAAFLDQCGQKGEPGEQALRAYGISPGTTPLTLVETSGCVEIMKRTAFLMDTMTNSKWLSEHWVQRQSVHMATVH